MVLFRHYDIDLWNYVLKHQKNSKKRAEAYLMRGQYYYCKNKYEWALEDLRNAKKITPDNPDVLHFIDKVQHALLKKPLPKKIDRAIIDEIGKETLETQ